MADLAEENATPVWRSRMNEASDRFKALPNNKKVLFLAAVAAIFAVIVGAVVLNRTPSYKILFSNISDRDGGQVAASLQQMNVPYQLGEGGTISVPSDKVYDARLKLAAQGLPKAGGVGFELMDNQKFGISQFAEQVNYQRAIEGELARTIEAVGSVESARVHIAIPKQSVFVREQQQPTASVMLTLFRGRLLDAGQIAGILHLVSSSVPNLPVKNVTIVDQDGNLLSKQSGPDENSGLDQRQLGYVRQVEEGYVKRIEDILEPIFGKGNSRAQVTASVDFAEVEQTSETFKPNSSPNPSATRSQQISEKLNNGAALPSGVPGALSNQPPSAASAPITLPPGAAPGTATLSGQTMGASGTLQRDITTNYEVDKTIQHTKMPQGGVKRLSAAVVVNYRRMPDKNGEMKPTPLTPQEVQQINNLVKEAMGFNTQRGDTLNVVNAAFADAEVPATLQEKVTDYVTSNGSSLLKYGLLTIAVLYLLFGVVRPIMRDLVKPPAPAKGSEEEAAAQAAAAGGRLLGVAGEEGEEGAAGHAGGAAGGGDPREAQMRQYTTNLEAVREMVKSDPRMAAQIIKEWISADE
ncbi:flagellar basal body M-ring protein FliF [Chromobacterium haemolyticum]|uniref:Flagellar M-ring protein n=2 Tax=Chromobacteriaceae TaxID=1499392 RepID=A0AAD0W869_9NEIS|nr:flagellar basal body M-ring protein FliF [Chromobacterium rhizoryzae]OQS36697.1 flagellar M-ring protein FliF [Chromobacterium haemolyticum]PTU70910.1 flagellar basal body M-ring protein FliF [Chromobacterium haemolyticum]QOD80904.1 flagellar M-ring protein FliF [Chromobacterium haemolyticum]